jgi:hypothetical protein
MKTQFEQNDCQSLFLPDNIGHYHICYHYGKHSQAVHAMKTIQQFMFYK